MERRDRFGSYLLGYQFDLSSMNFLYTFDQFVERRAYIPLKSPNTSKYTRYVHLWNHYQFKRIRQVGDGRILLRG